MDIRVESTPNPAARKFTVGVPVGGPATATSAETAPDGLRGLFDIDGVVSIFMTADFVTVSTSGAIDWSTAEPLIVEALQTAYES